MHYQGRYVVIIFHHAIVTWFEVTLTQSVSVTGVREGMPAYSF